MTITYFFFKRLFDLFFSFLCLILFSPLFIAVYALVFFNSGGPVFFWSLRIGRYGAPFFMPKFRTMSLQAPNVATHLLESPDKFLTPIGRKLRHYSLDELPQLWSIFIGNMSFVGPRPALFNQEDLNLLRSKFEVDQLMPGLTGWAQVNGRDSLSVSEKVQYDLEYLNHKSFLFDFRILLLTVIRVCCRDDVLH